MSCKQQLITIMDEAAVEYQFLGWECGDFSALTGKMRASGFNSAKGQALVFETFEYSTGEGIIQNMAYCYATFPIPTWVAPGNSGVLNVQNDNGEFGINFGTIVFKSHSNEYAINLERSDMLAAGYLSSWNTPLSVDALLFKLCDTLPVNALFSSHKHLKQAFGMPADVEHLFIAHHWSHPSYYDLYGEREIMPSEMPDLARLAEAVCKSQKMLTPFENPNTDWRQRCGSSNKT